MADEADITESRAEITLASNIIQSRQPEGPTAVGHCLNCGPDVPLPAPMRWCDGDCQEDWTHRTRRK